jgi:selenophosphate synthase
MSSGIDILQFSPRLEHTGVKEGDALILAKPLGSGVLFNANRSNKLPWRKLEEILPLLATLNNNSLGIATKFDVNACTDVTGFAIMGDTLETAEGNCPFIQMPLISIRREQRWGAMQTTEPWLEDFLR